MLLRKIHGNKPSVNHLFLAQRCEESAIFDFRETSNPTEIASNSSFSIENGHAVMKDLHAEAVSKSDRKHPKVVQPG